VFGKLNYMLTLSVIGPKLAERRKQLGMSQELIARRSLIGRTTLATLETGNLGEMGFSKLNRVLSVLNMELKLQEKRSARPTLEDLLEDEGDD
jgi:transcriptional regulator with XRE-family HTH domain